MGSARGCGGGEVCGEGVCVGVRDGVGERGEGGGEGGIGIHLFQARLEGSHWRERWGGGGVRGVEGGDGVEGCRGYLDRLWLG